jgi:hypothetical protein
MTTRSMFVATASRTKGVGRYTLEHDTDDSHGICHCRPRLRIVRQRRCLQIDHKRRTEAPAKLPAERGRLVGGRDLVQPVSNGLATGAEEGQRSPN